MFIKYSPLLDPIRYMIGNYDELQCKIQSTIEICDEKLLNHNNASYVDNFFNNLSSILLNFHEI